MIIDKYIPTNIQQEWHLFSHEYGNDKPDNDSPCLVITHNRDYAIACFAHKGEILYVDDGERMDGLSAGLIAKEDGFYTPNTFDGKKATIKKLDVTAWTKLPVPSDVFTEMHTRRK